MNTKFLEARDLIAKAREALRRGDKPSAWKMGEQAALLVPDMEDAWLILAASDPNPQDALAYAQKALEINPSSTRARKGVEWATDRLKQVQPAPEASVIPAKIELTPDNPEPKAKPGKQGLIYAASILGVLMCVVLVFAAYSAVTHPAFASILNNAPAPTQESLWAAVEIEKPSVAPLPVSAYFQMTPTPEAVLSQPETVAILPTSTSAEAAPPQLDIASVPSTSVPTDAVPTQPDAINVPPTSIPLEAATSTPAEIPAEVSTVIPEFTETPGSMAIEIVGDTPTSEYAAPPSSAPLPDIANTGNGVRWIDVDLTNQAVYAYEGDVMVNSFIVSTGTWLTPTVTGQYKVYVKYRYANMSGPGYFLPDVPYVMYFYKGYGIHGTYWHNNFGTPMSHGCVNLRTDDAGWVFNWASVGTLVNVHY